MLLQNICDLKVEDATYFHVVPTSTLISSIKLKKLLCPNELGEDWRPIGDIKLHAKRRTKDAPLPCVGKLGDYVAFANTPFTRDAFASSKVSDKIEAHQYSPQELAIVVTSQPKIDQARLFSLFTDRVASHSQVVVSGNPNFRNITPFDRYRERRFANDPSDPIGTAGYGAEVLVYREFPLGAATHIVVSDASLIPGLAELAKCIVPELRFAVRNWFFRRAN